MIHNPAWPGWVKIGCVFGTWEHVDRLLENRVSNLNVADPHNGFSVSTSRYAACALSAERYAHELFSIRHVRGHGEWFACDLEEAQRIVSVACEIARLRPNKRKRHFDAALEAEAGK